ncbi:MAG: hypothetical protein ACTSVV_11640 [Promethearchaeota archaeon]
MTSYDDIVEFNYLDMNEWEKYIQDYLVPIYKVASLFYEFNLYLKNEVLINLKDYFNNNENVKKLLLGGVNEKGEFVNISLAECIEKIFGIEFDRRNYLYYESIGENPFENDISLIHKDTLFILFVKKIKEKIENIFNLVSVEKPKINHKEINDIINNSNKIIDLLANLYTNITKFSANYNQQTFFIKHFYCTPFFYILEAYPKLKINLNFNKLREILKLKEIYVPPLRNEKLKKKYTIWGYKSKGLGDLIFSLQEFFENFHNYNEYPEIILKDYTSMKNDFDFIINLVINNPIDLKDAYINKLKEYIHLPSSFKFSPNKIIIGGAHNQELELVLLDQYIIKVTNGYAPTSTSRNQYYILDNIKINIGEFMETVAPYLFLNLAELHEIENISYGERILNSEEQNNCEFLRFSIKWS